MISSGKQANFTSIDELLGLLTEEIDVQASASPDMPNPAGLRPGSEKRS